MFQQSYCNLCAVVTRCQLSGLLVRLPGLRPGRNSRRRSCTSVHLLPVWHWTTARPAFGPLGFKPLGPRLTLLCKHFSPKLTPFAQAKGRIFRVLSAIARCGKKKRAQNLALSTPSTWCFESLWPRHEGSLWQRTGDSGNCLNLCPLLSAFLHRGLNLLWIRDLLTNTSV